MKSFFRFIGSIILLIIGLIAIIPFIYMIMTSLQHVYTSVDFKVSLRGMTLDNYKFIFESRNFSRYFLNSTFITISGVILNIVFSSLAAYAFAKMKFRGNNKIFFFMIMTLIIPTQVTMIPLYIIMKHLNWINSFLALILPIPTALGVFIMRQAIINIPNELLESAKIDGYSDFHIFTKIVIPLIKPAIITVSIFTFIGAWNEFLWPLIVSVDDKTRTLTVGLSTLQTQYTPNYGVMMAAATLTFLPPFIFYLILQKRFVEGVAATGLKG